ncbi:MAG TPA: RHS repeat-associated core domain-containing protein [Ktedonobacterales bacterium]|nr:RHS repeat-associated core domain-containing protein [Ktedonobacterales bacterium]
MTNITSSGATGASPGSYSYGDSAHLHAATATAGDYSATYDAAGDMTCRAPNSATTCTGASPTGAQLAYDAERRLTHSQDVPGASPNVEAWYLYDGAGNRVEQAAKQSEVTTSTYYLAGGAEEVHSDGSLIKYYGGLDLNTGSTAATILYLASDGLGSLQETLSSAGIVTAQQLNAPYGSVRYSSSTFPTTKGFTGQRADTAVSGLDYYGARYYDPSLGQFTSADSVLDRLNRYSYVGGNPETSTDPSGHMAEEYLRYGGGGGVGISVEAGDSVWVAVGGLFAALGATIGAIVNTPAAQGPQYYTYYRGLDRRAASYRSQTYSGVSGDELSRVHIPSGTPPTTTPVSLPTTTGIGTGLAGILAGLAGKLIHPPTTAPGHPGGIGAPSISVPTFDSLADGVDLAGLARATRGNNSKPGGDSPSAGAAATQDGTNAIAGWAGQPGLENPGFDLNGHRFGGGCAEVACAIQVINAVDSGASGWEVGVATRIALDHFDGEPPWPGCISVLEQLASYLEADVTIEWPGGLQEFVPGDTPFGGWGD